MVAPREIRAGAGRGGLGSLPRTGRGLCRGAGGGQLGRAARDVIEGRIDLGSTRIAGQLLIRDATLKAPGITPAGGGYSRARAGGTAVSAPRLSVSAETTFEGACDVAGGIDLSMSELSSLSIGPGCSQHAARRTALDLTNVEMRSKLTLRGSVIEGTVRPTGARICGNLSLQGAILSEPEGGPLSRPKALRSTVTWNCHDANRNTDPSSHSMAPTRFVRQSPLRTVRCGVSALGGAVGRA